ncbi:MAG: HAD family phosphatase [Phycisphaerales bacterium]|nr:HAD family phosphatase [Phycisphaerales bacterium]
MKQPYDLLAIDLDGTLLDERHTVPRSNRAALHRAHEAGWRIVLCTGRAFTETRPVLQEIGLDLDATVTVFGALVSDARTGETLQRTALDRQTARRVTDWFLERGLPVLWLTDAQEVGHDGYVIAGRRRHPAVDRWVERTPCHVTAVSTLPAEAAAPVRLSVIDDLKALDEVSAALHLAFGESVRHNILRAPPYDLSLIETFAPVVNKWYGIAWLCRRWGLDPRRTVAVGDDVNDLDMLRNAGLGVAMGNARDVVKAAAARTVAPHHECGVAQLLDELLTPSAA